MSDAADSSNLESQLDALLSQVEADTASPAEVVEAKQPDTAEQVVETPEDPAAAVEATSDLAAQLDAMLAASDPEPESTTADANAQSDVEAFDGPNLEGSFEAPDESSGAADSAPIDPAEAEAALASSSDLAAQLDAMLEASAEPEPPLDEPAAPPETQAVDPAGDFEASGSFEAPDPQEEAELLSAIEADVAADAEAALEDTEAGGDFVALADMLGVDAAELEAIPAADEVSREEASTPDEASANPASEDADDELLGSFESVDDLLGSLDDALAEFEADPADFANEAVEPTADQDPEPVAEDDSLDDDEFAGSFESVDGLDAEPEEATEPEAFAETEAPSAESAASESEDLEFAGAYLSIDDALSDHDPIPGPADQADASYSSDAKAESPAPTKGSSGDTWKKLTATTAAASKQGLATGQDLAIRLKPHAITGAKLAYRGFKIGCFHAHRPLDMAAGKLKKEDADAPPLRQYTGIAAMAVLIPGLLLTLLGLFT